MHKLFTTCSNISQLTICNKCSSLVRAGFEDLHWFSFVKKLKFLVTQFHSVSLLIYTETLSFFFFFLHSQKVFQCQRCHTAGSATLLHLSSAAVVLISMAAGGSLPLSMLGGSSEFTVACLDVFVS